MPSGDELAFPIPAIAGAFFGIYSSIGLRLDRAMEGFPWPLSWEECRKVPLLDEG
jgi:hypothetical protein